MSLEETLERLEKSIPLANMCEYNPNGTLNGHYKRRLALIKEIEEAKGLHRQIIFGDAPDETF